jgi:tetratricopeptide (TPR) repeat protein
MPPLVAGQDEHDLGWKYFQLKRYSEAEVTLQISLQRRERELGKDHKETLGSKRLLGLTLCMQQKYSEAEEVFQQLVCRQESILGRDHEDTLDSKRLLGRAFYDQKKYSEAEELFQQTLHGQERMLGKDHEITLDSKNMLGCLLYEQEKYSEAEEVLQQAVHGQEKTLGKDHRDTLDSKSRLGRTLCVQEKYSKAEQMLQQAVHGQERMLGKDHAITLNSKYWLGRTFYEQKRYDEAKEMLQQSVHGLEDKLGKDHEDALFAKRLYQILFDNSYSPLPMHITTPQTLTGRLSSFFPEGEDIRESYTDPEICEISLLLEHSNPQWSKMPRTYVVLRTIGFLEILDDLIDAGFSDYWFPVTEQNLPDCLRPSVRAAFVSAQSLVLTRSIDLERGEHGQHCHFKQGESPPLESKGILGNGGFGQVDKVLSQISFKEYARKRVLRSSAFSGRRKEDIKQFIAEIQILKRLKHHHVVRFVGSYSDARYIGLIMSPVAEMDLAAYLTRVTASHHPELRTFFGCLARALEFLHEHKVRHKDIKPGNILVHAGVVLFTDFGLSLDFTDASGSTTISMVNGMTPRYCAPEVTREEPRNTMSDIWSLGAVFMEIIAVLKGKTTRYKDEFYEQHRSWQAFVCTNPAALLELVIELEAIGALSDNRALGWTQQMLSVEQQLRPTASSLVASITEGGRMDFCGICCFSHEEEFSDYGDEESFA